MGIRWGRRGGGWFWGLRGLGERLVWGWEVSSLGEDGLWVHDDLGKMKLWRSGLIELMNGCVTSWVSCA